MATNDPFGFETAREDEVDLSAFAPKPKRIDKGAAAAASEVAQGAGFSRRTKPARAVRPAVAPAPSVEPAPAKPRGRRINVRELPGASERYADADKAQLNMLVPVPVLLRWRELCRTAGTPAWEVLERAIEALELDTAAPGGGRA